MPPEELSSGTTHTILRLRQCRLFDGHCLGGGVSASVALGLPPPYLDFGWGLSACPVVQLNIDLQALPSASANVGVNSCF